jgi:ABC-2 type transport system ATP-binding protein
MSAERVLSLSGVGKSYGGHRALARVSFEVRQGEIVGLLGPNGAGKSTLFQIAAGLFAPDEGEVRLFGLAYRDAHARILRRLGVVFQTRSLDPEMSVRGNLRFHAGLFGLRGPELAARIGELAEIFGFAGYLDRPVRLLSGGEQRRVEIARALLNRPDLLLLDEPSSGLDAPTRATLVAHMGGLARARGTALLWATHLVDELGGADRIVMLRRGEVVADGPAPELVARTGAHDLAGAYAALTGPKPGGGLSATSPA